MGVHKIMIRSSFKVGPRKPRVWPKAASQIPNHRPYKLTRFVLSRLCKAGGLPLARHLSEGLDLSLT